MLRNVPKCENAKSDERKNAERKGAHSTITTFMNI